MPQGNVLAIRDLYHRDLWGCSLEQSQEGRKEGMQEGEMRPVASRYEKRSPPPVASSRREVSGDGLRHYQRDATRSLFLPAFLPSCLPARSSSRSSAVSGSSST